MPSGKSAQPLITDNLDGTVTVQYSPTEAGLHEMHIQYNGTHIPGQYIYTVEGEMMTSGVQKENCSLVSLLDINLLSGCLDSDVMVRMKHAELCACVFV